MKKIITLAMKSIFYLSHNKNSIDIKNSTIQKIYKNAHLHNIHKYLKRLQKLEEIEYKIMENIRAF